MARALAHKTEALDSVRPILEILRARESEIRAFGVDRLAVFGSVARGEDDTGSDVDIVVRLRSPDPGGYAYFSRLESLRQRLGELLGRRVDVVTEPIRKPSLRRAVEADQILAF